MSPACGFSSDKDDWHKQGQLLEIRNNDSCRKHHKGRDQKKVAQRVLLAEKPSPQGRKGGSEECRRCDYPDLERVKADFGEISGQDNHSKAVPKPSSGAGGVYVKHLIEGIKSHLGCALHLTGGSARFVVGVLLDAAIGRSPVGS